MSDVGNITTFLQQDVLTTIITTYPIPAWRMTGKREGLRFSEACETVNDWNRIAGKNAAASSVEAGYRYWVEK